MHGEDGVLINRFGLINYRTALVVSSTIVSMRNYALLFSCWYREYRLRELIYDDTMADREERA